MRLSLTQTEAVSRLATLLYDLLPGNPHPYADRRLSFLGVARDLGVGGMWTGGSKKPAITRLLEGVLEQAPERFCEVVLETVRRSIPYRGNKGSPVVRDEVVRINRVVEDIGFKIPELWAPRFLDSLPRARADADVAARASATGAPQQSKEELVEFTRALVALSQLAPQRAGIEFENVLGKLFEVSQLAPRSAFRLAGEQIDGSFELDRETYLVEAKWQKEQVDLNPLLAFDGRVTGKATWSRGVFVSYAGFTRGAVEAFGRGRKASFVGFDGRDLHCVLEGRVPLPDAIRMKVRRTGETGEFMAPLDVLLREKGL